MPPPSKNTSSTKKRTARNTITFVRGTYPKKYKAILPTGKTVQFGHQDYAQYKDRTPQKLYRHKDHLDKERRKRYRQRHAAITTASGARAVSVKYSPAWFSLNYLW